MEQSEIRTWLEANAKLMPDTAFASDELDHVAMCMHHLYRWYHEGYPIGDFLTAVVKNDFTEACFQADDTNRKAFYLYALFVANKISLEHRKKALARSNFFLQSFGYEIRR